jgi:hypothetical protein
MFANRKAKWLRPLFSGQKSLLIWIALVLLLAAIWFFKYEVIEDYIPKQFGVVERGCIYRSGQLDAELVKRILTRYKIGLIISLSGDSSDDIDKKAERRSANALGIERLVLPLSGDGTGDIKIYAEAISAICRAKKQGRPVLVHCSAGSQRTSGVIAAYRLLIEKKDVPFVLAEMKRYGANTDCNSPLLQYLDSSLEDLSRVLRQMGVIENISSPLPQIHP